MIHPIKNDPGYTPEELDRLEAFFKQFDFDPGPPLISRREKMNSLGVIETRGLTAAIQAADAAL